MTKFKPGDFVRLEYVPDNYIPYKTRQLARFVGKVGYINECYLTGVSVMYEVLFKNYSSWIPEESLNFVGRPETEPKLGRVLKFLSTDTWGEPFSIITKPNPDKLPGWVTEISHRAYADGGSIIVAICVSDAKATPMHQKWIEILTHGPLPFTVEEVGLGSWKSGAVIHPRASWYTAIPLGY